ncbi:hypothetical protein Btru_069445 [Bulinus truncatus]|nr:hypothetical protein Btru_069445 [Bulinus truncatus]
MTSSPLLRSTTTAYDIQLHYPRSTTTNFMCPSSPRSPTTAMTSSPLEITTTAMTSATLRSTTTVQNIQAPHSEIHNTTMTSFPLEIHNFSHRTGLDGVSIKLSTEEVQKKGCGREEGGWDEQQEVRGNTPEPSDIVCVFGRASTADLVRSRGSTGSDDTTERSNVRRARAGLLFARTHLGAKCDGMGCFTADDEASLIVNPLTGGSESVLTLTDESSCVQAKENNPVEPSGAIPLSRLFIPLRYVTRVKKFPFRLAAWQIPLAAHSPVILRVSDRRDVDQDPGIH